MHEVDYLLVGHVAEDLQPDGSYRPGGTVTFAAQAASALGLRVGVITSAGPRADLSLLRARAVVDVLPAAHSTVFENRYSATGRTQVLHSRASVLTPSAAAGWVEPKVLHLAPIADEVSAGWGAVWPNGFVGLTPQGWLRAWDAAGRVFPKAWAGADYWLARANAVVLSEEDVAYDWALLHRWAQQTQVLAVTRGAQGARVFVAGVPFDVPAPVVEEVDPTGAGDVFAAVFFSQLQAHGDVRGATEAAVARASASVTVVGVG